MVDIQLGINTEFASTKWPLPRDFMDIIHSEFELDLFEFSFDLLDPRVRESTKIAYIGELVELCDAYQIQLYSTYTGLAQRTSNLLLHPDFGMRIDALKWFEKAIDITVGLDAPVLGGYVGSISNSDLKNFEKASFLFQCLKDSILYLTSVMYEAGLNRFLLEIPLLDEVSPILAVDNSIIDSIQKNIIKNIQEIKESSKIPIDVVINDKILNQSVLFPSLIQDSQYVRLGNLSQFEKFMELRKANSADKQTLMLESGSLSVNSATDINETKNFIKQLMEKI